MAPFPMVGQLIARGQMLVTSQIESQWSNPSDILSLLLLVGGDVVQRALAQQTGGNTYLPPPVVFSFGWVAYTFCGLLAAVGDGTFLPNPEAPAIVFSKEWGYQRSSQSWIISRFLRDYEKLWMPAPVRARLDQMLAEAGRRRSRAGLCVAVFEAGANAVAGVPKRDLLWYSGYAIAAVQLALAAIPWATNSAWEIFAVTLLGTCLAFFTASLPHWTQERWACNRNATKTFILSRGNGAQHAIVIIGAGRSLDFEDLATSFEGLPPLKYTQLVYAGLTVMWCALLITVCGIQTQTWFLIAVGSIGMIHTVVVAGAPRKPETLGIHLEYRDVFAQPKVMKTLKEVESKYPGIGRAMVGVFFPGELHESEKAWWQEAWWREVRERELAHGKKSGLSPPSETSSTSHFGKENAVSLDDDGAPA